MGAVFLFSKIDGGRKSATSYFENWVHDGSENAHKTMNDECKDRLGHCQNSELKWSLIETAVAHL